MKKMLPHLKPYLLQILAVVVLVFVSVIADLSLPNFLSNIINYGVAEGNTGYILSTGGLMLFFALISIVATIISGFLSAKVSMGFGKKLRSVVFNQVEKFSLSEFDQFGTASLITRTTNDITQIQQFVMIFLRIILMAPIIAIGGILMAYRKSPQMSNIIFVSIPILIILIMIIAKLAMPLSKSMQKKLDRVNLVMREKLTGIRVIRAFNTEDHEKERFEQANRDLTTTAMKMQRTMALLMPALMVTLNLTTVALVWLGAVQVNIGSMMVGDIIALVQYVMQIMMSFTMMSMIFIMYPRAAASAERINQVTDTVPTIQNKANAICGTTLKGQVEFRNVTFTYPHAEQPALHDISFATHPGETTAIIGSTGSGKSTLINLIPRFYDVDSGSILVDGIDVREYDQQALRAKIGYVPQKATLFKGTIGGNIRYGKNDATDEEIEYASKIAQSNDFIMEKEHRYDSDISQGATNVSGGQKQRLSIARAIVRRPEIYIFDDSFSALDFKTDSQLRAALKNETKNAAVIIVAQRVSTIMDADQIIVLDSGEMVGIGTHHELLENCDVYKEIVSSQLSSEEMQ